MKFLIILFSTLAASISGATEKPADSLKSLRETLVRIQKTKLVEFQLEKKVVSEIMGSEKTYHGRSFLQGSLFRFEIKDPDKSLVVFDGKTLWIVQYPNPGLGGPTQVLRGQIHGKQKEQMLLTELLAKGKLLDSFTLAKTGEDDSGQSFEGTPKDKGFNLQKVNLTVKGKELKKLEYVDDVGNKTSLNVIEQKLQADPRPELFRYKPEKGAQVTNL